MQETITFTLPRDVKLALDDVTRKEGISSSELISEAIKQYLFLWQFRLLRERMIPKAEAQGIRTDQDVLNRVS